MPRSVIIGAGGQLAEPAMQVDGGVLGAVKVCPSINVMVAVCGAVPAVRFEKVTFMKRSARASPVVSISKR